MRLDNQVLIRLNYCDDLVSWQIKVRGLVNAKAIHKEEQ